SAPSRGPHRRFHLAAPASGALGEIAAPRNGREHLQRPRPSGSTARQRLLEPAWESHDYLAKPEAKAIFGELFAPFARKHTKTYLYQTGQSRRIPICPVNTPRDILTLAQADDGRLQRQQPYRRALRQR